MRCTMDLFNGCFIVGITALGPIIKRATVQFNFPRRI